MVEDKKRHGCAAAGRPRLCHLRINLSSVTRREGRRRRGHGAAGMLNKHARCARRGMRAVRERSRSFATKERGRQRGDTRAPRRQVSAPLPWAFCASANAHPTPSRAPSPAAPLFISCCRYWTENFWRFSHHLLTRNAHWHITPLHSGRRCAAGRCIEDMLTSCWHDNSNNATRRSTKNAAIMLLWRS